MSRIRRSLAASTRIYPCGTISRDCGVTQPLEDAILGYFVWVYDGHRSHPKLPENAHHLHVIAAVTDEQEVEAVRLLELPLENAR